MRVVLAQINLTVGDIQGNTKKIIHSLEVGVRQRAEIVLFPEMCISGYPPEDFLLLPEFIEATEKALQEIIPFTKGLTAIVGLPRLNPARKEKKLFNSAAVISHGHLLGFQDKMLLPTYDVFDERRYFEPGEESKIWEIADRKVGITICEDIWQHKEILQETSYKTDPIHELQLKGVDLLLNLSASPYSVSKYEKRVSICRHAAKTLQAPVLLCNQVGGNDGLIFDGCSLYVNAQGNLIKEGKGFEEEHLFIDLLEAAQPNVNQPNCTESLYKALALGIHDYFKKLGFKKACFGLSGGIDSAVVACLAAEALGKENVLGLMMPSRFSSEGSLRDAEELAKTVGFATKKIDIEPIFTSFLAALAPLFEDLPFDVTEENLQARIRGVLLMAFSNKFGYIVLSTGNKSELAMGYSTLYGDMCGGLSVISDVTKQQVYELARWINRKGEIIPVEILEKAPSAELRPNQKDSDSLPEYCIIDQVLKAHVEDHQSPQEIAGEYNYPEPLVIDLVRRIHRNEYKRRQSPFGLRVSEKSFSIGRRFPIVQKFI